MVVVGRFRFPCTQILNRMSEILILLPQEHASEELQRTAESNDTIAAPVVEPQVSRRVSARVVPRPDGVHEYVRAHKVQSDHVRWQFKQNRMYPCADLPDEAQHHGGLRGAEGQSVPLHVQPEALLAAAARDGRQSGVGLAGTLHALRVFGYRNQKSMFVDVGND